MRRIACLTAMALASTALAQPPPPDERERRPYNPYGAYDRDRRPYDPDDRYSRDDPYYRDGRYYRDPIYYDQDVRWRLDRYDRFDQSRWARGFRGRWVPLITGVPARTGRQFIQVRGGRFSALRIESVAGEPVIQKIAIEFRNRTGQAMELWEPFPAGTGQVIDLVGGERRIDRIIIYTDPRSAGAYSVYGA